MNVEQIRVPWAFVLVAVAVAIGGCGTGAGPSGTGGVSSPSAVSSPPASPSTSAAALVGEWVGFHDCERMVALLHGNALDEFIAETVYGNGLVPGVTTEADLKDPARPCVGAERREHSHVFTADGLFGSRDFNGQQVDDGHYEIQGTDTLVINDVPFKFEIDGDQLSLEPEPVDISVCTTKECRFTAAWVLMVAMPGTTWTRGTISNESVKTRSITRGT